MPCLKSTQRVTDLGEKGDNEISYLSAIAILVTKAGHGPLYMFPGLSRKRLSIHIAKDSFPAEQLASATRIA